MVLNVGQIVNRSNLVAERVVEATTSRLRISSEDDLKQVRSSSVAEVFKDDPDGIKDFFRLLRHNHHFLSLDSFNKFRRDLIQRELNEAEAEFRLIGEKDIPIVDLLEKIEGFNFDYLLNEKLELETSEGNLTRLLNMQVDDFKSRNVDSSAVFQAMSIINEKAGAIFQELLSKENLSRQEKKTLGYLMLISMIYVDRNLMLYPPESLKSIDVQVGKVSLEKFFPGNELVSKGTDFANHIKVRAGLGYDPLESWIFNKYGRINHVQSSAFELASSHGSEGLRDGEKKLIGQFLLSDRVIEYYSGLEDRKS